MNVAAVAPFSNVECPTCGRHTRVKREFGPYTLVRRHAIGGMSMVFVAQDNTLNREVALKILSEDFSADERRIAAFEEEARITASFSHPHVVRVLRTGKAFGRFYIAMELVPGGHFEHQIRERGKIPEVEMLPLAIEVAQGLKAAHSAGLIHRDVKPGNILLDAEGHAKIVDFGLALVTQGGTAQATEIWATPYYVPPETIEGIPEDFRSDIYAFGATLYHALAGTPSCGEQSMATEALRLAKKKVVPLGEADASLSVEVCKIVDRAMAYDPRDRFSSYDEMISRLEVALKRLVTGAAGDVETSASAARRREKKKREELVVWSFAGVVLLAAVSGGIWWITRDAPQPVRKDPVLTDAAPIIPDSTSAAAVDIAKHYREARAAVEARDFEKAAAGFAGLRGDSSVQEPTRTWAGVEAVVARYLDGDSAEARKEAKETSAHIASVEGDLPRVGAVLSKMLGKLGQLPPISVKEADASGGDGSHVVAWLLAGLKNWEQGMLAEAGKCFSAVAEAKISADEPWLAIYQNFARDYLADQKLLSAPVFEKLPADAAACDAAVAELDGILAKLKTRGRARFNVRAWQLDLAKHSKLLAAPKAAPTAPVKPSGPVWDPVAAMAKLEEFSKDCLFPEAAAFLKSFPADSTDAAWTSLLSLTESSAVFLADLQADIAKQPMNGEFLMKSGEVINGIFIDDAGSLTATDGTGRRRPVKWGEFSVDALIGLHRIVVKNPMSEAERLRRHECAISYAWIAGDREHALAAAATLAQGSPAFKQRWDSIAGGLPK
jgi:serine/threonine protein kinase